MPCPVEAAEAPAILAFAASVREAGGAVLPLLQRQPARTFADMADSGAFTMGTLPIVSCHEINLSISCAAAPCPGIAGKSTYSGFPAAAFEFLRGTGGIFRPLFEKRAENPGVLPVPRPNP